MVRQKLSFRAQKMMACVFHLICLAFMFAGVGLMYLNDNLGVGITHIQSGDYEDTEAFTDYFNEDLSDIFHYIEYHGIFATGGSIDISKIMLQMTFGPSDTRNFSLDDIIRYLKGQGYYLNEDFQCTPVSVEENRAQISGYVSWSASQPDQRYASMQEGIRHCTLEEISLEIIDTLHRYYTTYKRLLEAPSNLHFRIEYMDQTSEPKRLTSYSNDVALTLEQAKTLGRYASLQGNSVFYDTNFKSIDLDTVSALAANNPYPTKTYYLLAALDTSYPVWDAYAEQHYDFVQMQNYYILGFALMAAGGAGALAALFFLFLAAGKKGFSDPEITLHGFDANATETGVLLFVTVTGLALFIGKYTAVRIVHVTLPQESWPVGEKVLYSAIVYAGCLTLAFSLLRRYRAGTLWENSLARKISSRFSIFLSHQSFAGQLTITAFTYLAVNTILVAAAVYLYVKWRVLTLPLRLMLAALTFLWACLNLWVFYLMFRRSADHDRLDSAICRLAKGETSYQVDVTQFDGKTREVAENLNNISTGLETALTEKVKSERLKADLITNVSHDIKTPLTSIINYVDLIKRENIQDEKIQRYLEVLEQKSHRLKNLTEDLVEASKASSGNLKLEICRIDFMELVYQTNGEFEEKFASRRLDLITSVPDQALIIEADGRRLWRVLENLYNNAFKYALEGSRIYVDAAMEKGVAVFTIKNMSANPLNIKGEELTERFVRGDVARTTEGSGLGLSIAKDLTQLQGGVFEIYIDGDLFKVKIAFPLAEAPAREAEGQAGDEAPQ